MKYNYGLSSILIFQDQLVRKFDDFMNFQPPQVRLQCSLEHNSYGFLISYYEKF